MKQFQDATPEDGGRLADMVPTWAHEQLRYSEWWFPFRQIMNFVFLRRTQSKALLCLPVGVASLLWYIWVLYMRLAQIPFYLHQSKQPAFGIDMVIFAICCLPGLIYSVLGIFVVTRLGAILGLNGTFWLSAVSITLQVIEFTLFFSLACVEVTRLVWYYWNHKRFLEALFDASIQQYTGCHDTVQVLLRIAWNPPPSGFLTFMVFTTAAVYLQYYFLDICRSLFRQVRAGGTGWTYDSAEMLTRMAKQLEAMPTQGPMEPPEEQAADMTQALGLLSDNVQGDAARFSIQQRLLATPADAPDALVERRSVRAGVFGVPPSGIDGLRKRSSPTIEDIESQVDELGRAVVAPLSPSHQHNLQALQSALAKRGGSPSLEEFQLPPHLLQYFVGLTEEDQQEFLEMTCHSLKGEKPTTQKLTP